MNKRTLFFIFLIVFILSLSGNIIFLLSPKFYSFRKEIRLKDSYTNKLTILGTKAVESRDVPVASILIYEDSIIGEGYNDVLKNSHAGGHAEINAISDAIKKISFPEFKKLDRNKLILITTFEPCAMCRGAIIEYNIKKVAFVKSKSIVHWTKELLKQERYEWNKHSTDHHELQDSLFMKFPGYTKEK